MRKEIQVLIVDDDSKTRELLGEILNEGGCKITEAESIATAKKELDNKKFYNVVLIDLKLPDGSGIELVKEAKRASKETIVIIFTGYASLESAVSAMKEGVFAYFAKPLNIDELRLAIKKALEMQKLALDNKKLLNRLKALSLKDPLTGLYNYRYLRERLASEFKRAKRYILPISILMIDLDYFKSINDIYGHRYGDTILQEVARRLQNFSRSTDIVIRYGGAEFLIIMPDTSKDSAVKAGTNLLNNLLEHSFGKKNSKIKLKVSIGISNFPEDSVVTELNFLDFADEALRNAKEKGGNRVSTLKSAGKEEMEDIVQDCGGENINKLKEKLLKLESRENQTLLESIYAFAKTIAAKDYYTGEHAESMVSITSSIGKALQLSDKDIENLKHAATLHDLGKIGIPDNILQKKGKLSKKEFNIIKKHPKIGAEIIRSVHFLNEVVPSVLYHHERFDGLGYSTGLKGNEIPLGARIIAVADVYQALISDRPYRKAYSRKYALEIIKEGSGTHFDPEVVNAFVSLIEPKAEHKNNVKCLKKRKL
ncbi:MAG: diguanylate cyclase [Candidatus Omnitrophota bacterium]